MKKFPMLYKRSTKGVLQQWQIIVDGDHFWTEAGQVGGKITVSKPTYAKGKNIGRSNETSPEEQALFEATARHKKKVEMGMSQEKGKAGDGPEFFVPMTAHKLKERWKKVTFPAYVQRKSDGIRGIFQKDSITTRNGKPHMCAGHIAKVLAPLFEADPDMILDGELYNHDLFNDFDKLSSLIRKQKPTQAELDEAAAKVKFYCYDAPRIAGMDESAPFLDRYEAMKKLLKGLPNIQVVATYKITTREQVDEYHEMFAEQGFEGLMLRQNGPYENKRSNNLLKYKVFDDDEFVIEDILEGTGNRAGLAATFIMTAKSGNRFESNIKVGWDKLKEIWENKEDYIGMTVTVRYFGLTPKHQVPRFGWAIDFDRWRYE